MSSTVMTPPKRLPVAKRRQRTRTRRLSAAPLGNANDTRTRPGVQLDGGIARWQGGAHEAPGSQERARVVRLPPAPRLRARTLEEVWTRPGVVAALGGGSAHRAARQDGARYPRCL